MLVPPPSVFRIKTAAMFHGNLIVTLECEDSPLTYLPLSITPLSRTGPFKLVLVGPGGVGKSSLISRCASALVHFIAFLPFSISESFQTHQIRSRTVH